MLRIEPAAKRAVRVLQRHDAPRVLDGRIDLEAIADDARIGEQPAPLAPSVARHALDREVVERRAERLALLQDREPREPRLVDLEHEAFEQRVVGAQREPVFAVVVGAVPGVSGSDAAVAHAGGGR